MAAKSITLYSSKVCPWAARTWIALEQAGIPYQLKEVDLRNKPDWFLKVSATGKVPTLAVGDDVLVESSITTRYVAEAFPKSGLLTKDPLVDAKSELWADRYINVVGTSFYYSVKKMEPSEIHNNFFTALDTILPYLCNGKFSAGSNAPLLGDALVAPFIGRIHLHLQNGVLPQSISDKLNSDSKYKPYLQYVQAIMEWPAFKKIHDPEAIHKSYMAHFA